MSRVGTARALVLLGSGVQLAVTGVGSFLVLVLGPVLQRHGAGGSPVLGVVVYVVITLAAIALANLLAVRANGVRAVVALGCGTLLAGLVLSIAALLVLITTG